MSRERFFEISQNFRSAGYMPSARSILLQNSKNHLTILRFTLKFEDKFANLTHRDPHLENVNLNTRQESAKFNLRVAQQLLTYSEVGEGLLLAVARQSRSKERRRFVITTPLSSPKKKKKLKFQRNQNLAPPRLGSRCVKFINLIPNFYRSPKSLPKSSI